MARVALHNKTMNKLIIILLSLLLMSCGRGETIPKPKGYLSLNYPKVGYTKLDIARPYKFDVSKNSIVVQQPKNWLKIEYPALKASVNITYRPVKDNLRELLIEAEKLVYEHTVKADQIVGRDYMNKKDNVYGKLAEITGNAASQLQFHVTDSTRHFLKGSLFFYSRPNYDSIYPAVEYLKKDMIRIMETLEWKNQ